MNEHTELISLIAPIWRDRAEQLLAALLTTNQGRIDDRTKTIRVKAR